jgi:hypothetical protein
VSDGLGAVSNGGRALGTTTTTTTTGSDQGLSLETAAAEAGAAIAKSWNGNRRSEPKKELRWQLELQL